METLLAKVVRSKSLLVAFEVRVAIVLLGMRKRVINTSANRS